MPLPPFEFVVFVFIAASSVIFIGLGLRGIRHETRLNRRLTGLGERARDNSTGGVSTGGVSLGWLRPFERIFVAGSKDREEIARYLRAAGYYDPQAVLIFAALRLAAVIAVAAGTGLVLWLTGRWAGLARFYPLVGAAVVYLLAKFVLQWRASVRQRRVGAELPFLLDLLLLMLESGISLDQCFRSMAQSLDEAAPISRQAVAVMVEDIQRGMPYDQALDRWAERLGVAGIRELAAMFKQTLTHGTELGAALREFVKEFSEKRVSRARESIGRKTAKMTVVMIVFLMPALFIVLCGPAVVSLMANLTRTG
jgi:tight adherence protein C